MKSLVKAEIYKFRKQNIFTVIILFNFISILYSLGIAFNWSWVSINGQYDLIQYIGAMWQLLFLIGLPLIFFMYIGSSILGGERVEGQILLEVTRVSNRNKIIASKIIAMTLVISFYFLTNLITSSLGYIFFVNNTKFATVDWIILNKGNLDLFLSCAFGYIYIIISTIIVMYLSIKNGPIISTILGISLYAIFSLIARMPGISLLIPGYYALSSTAYISVFNTIQQIIWCIFIMFIIIYLMQKKINKIDL